MEDNRNGKYVGYLRSLEGSVIVFHDNLDFIKSHWCIGMKIFESNGLNMDKIQEMFPDKPEIGTVLTYLEENLKRVYAEGITRL